VKKVNMKKISVGKIHNLTSLEKIFFCLVVGHKFVRHEWYPGKVRFVCIICGAYERITDPRYPHIHEDALKLLQRRYKKGEAFFSHYGFQKHVYLDNYACRDCPNPMPVKYKYK